VIRATYRLMEIPEPNTAESFWTLPNHQFSDPLLLQNPLDVAPPALCRTLCCPPFSVLLSRSIDTFLRFSPHVEYPETLVSGESFYGEDRIIFLIFVYTISRREGNYIHFHMFHKSIDNNVASTDTTQKWRRVSLPAIIRMRKLFLLPSRRKLRRKLSSYSKCVW